MVINLEFAKVARQILRTYQISANISENFMKMQISPGRGRGQRLMDTYKVKDTHWWWSIACFGPSYSSRNHWHKLLLSRGEAGAWSTVPRSSDFQSSDSWDRWLFSIAWLGESLIVAVSAFSLTETRHIALKWPGQTIPTTKMEILTFLRKRILSIFCRQYWDKQTVLWITACSWWEG